MAEIAVLGGGSLGLLIAGRLAASGCDCVLWTRTSGQASLLNDKGLTLEEQSGQSRTNVKLEAVPIDEISDFKAGPVLLTVKQTTLTPEFLEKLQMIVSPGGTLVLFQNGIGHLELLQQALPGRRLITAVTTEGALRIDSTTVRHTGRGETGIGEQLSMDTVNEQLLFVEHLLKQGGFTVFLSKQLEEVIFRKLLVNAVINPLTAILRIRNGELTKSAERLRLMKAVFQETFGILSLYALKNESESELWNRVIEVCNATADNESSMLQDVTLHKETEIEFINGAICRLATRQGKDAPWNEAVTALIKAAY